MEYKAPDIHERRQMLLDLINEWDLEDYAISLADSAIHLAEHCRATDGFYCEDLDNVEFFANKIRERFR